MNAAVFWRSLTIVLVLITSVIGSQEVASGVANSVLTRNDAQSHKDTDELTDFIRDVLSVQEHPTFSNQAVSDVTASNSAERTTVASSNTHDVDTTISEFLSTVSPEPKFIPYKAETAVEGMAVAAPSVSDSPQKQSVILSHPTPNVHGATSALPSFDRTGKSMTASRGIRKSLTSPLLQGLPEETYNFSRTPAKAAVPLSDRSMRTSNEITSLGLKEIKEQVAEAASTGHNARMLTVARQNNAVAPLKSKRIALKETATIVHDTHTHPQYVGAGTTTFSRMHDVSQLRFHSGNAADKTRRNSSGGFTVSTLSKAFAHQNLKPAMFTPSDHNPTQSIVQERTDPVVSSQFNLFVWKRATQKEQVEGAVVNSKRNSTRSISPHTNHLLPLSENRGLNGPRVNFTMLFADTNMSARNLSFRGHHKTGEKSNHTARVNASLAFNDSRPVLNKVKSPISEKIIASLPMGSLAAADDEDEDKRMPRKKVDNTPGRVLRGSGSVNASAIEVSRHAFPSSHQSEVSTPHDGYSAKMTKQVDGLWAAHVVTIQKVPKKIHSGIFMDQDVEVTHRGDASELAQSNPSADGKMHGGTGNSPQYTLSESGEQESQSIGQHVDLDFSVSAPLRSEKHSEQKQGWFESFVAWLIGTDYSLGKSVKSSNKPVVQSRHNLSSVQRSSEVIAKTAMAVQHDHMDTIPITDVWAELEATDSDEVYRMSQEG